MRNRRQELVSGHAARIGDVLGTPQRNNVMFDAETVPVGLTEYSQSLLTKVTIVRQSPTVGTVRIGMRALLQSSGAHYELGMPIDEAVEPMYEPDEKSRVLRMFLGFANCVDIEYPETNNHYRGTVIADNKRTPTLAFVRIVSESMLPGLQNPAAEDVVGYELDQY